MKVSHLCHQKICFNPQHLIVESHLNNTRRHDCAGCQSRRSCGSKNSFIELGAPKTINRQWPAGFDMAEMMSVKVVWKDFSKGRLKSQIKSVVNADPPKKRRDLPQNSRETVKQYNRFESSIASAEDIKYIIVKFLFQFLILLLVLLNILIIQILTLSET